MKVKFPNGDIVTAVSLEHAKRMYSMFGAVPTEDSKLVLEGEEIKMAKRPVKKVNK